MQKKLIALAIAGAIAAPAAFAADSAVTIYGQLDMSIDSINSDNKAAAADTHLTRVSSNSSRIGFKGTEELGNGLKANWQIEQSIGMDGTGTSTLGTRNTYVGLGGNWGEVRLGKHDTPHKMATAPLDIFADTAGDYNNIIGAASVAPTGAGTAGTNNGLKFDNRTNNTVAYISPNFSGLTAAVAWTANADNTTSAGIESSNGAAKNQSAVSLGLMYQNGPIYVGYGYERLNNVVGAASDKALTDNKLGFGFAGDGYKVGLIYDKMADESGDTAFDRSAWVLNGQINAGPGAVKLAYGKANNSKAAGGDDNAKTFVVGYDYPMSKRTKLYALYAKVTNATNGYYNIGAGQGQFLSGSDMTAAGQDPSVWSFGVRHSF